MRNAPSRSLIVALWAAGANVRPYDPAAMAETARIYGERDYLVLAGRRDGHLHRVEGPFRLSISTG